jgi:hypothetical protein
VDEIKNTPTTFVPLPPVAVIVAPKLSQQDAAKLLEVVNDVRSGEHVYAVTVTYDKVTKAKPRIEGQHYQALPGTTNKLHTGTVVAAPTNKKGAVYLLVRDAARAPVAGEEPVEEEDEAGWTAMKPEGLTSFKVLPNGKLPGPVAAAREAAKAKALADVQAAVAKIQAQ